AVCLDGVLETLADPYALLEALNRAAAANPQRRLTIVSRPVEQGPSVRWFFDARSLTHLLERASWQCHWTGVDPRRPRSLLRRAAAKLRRKPGLGSGERGTLSVMATPWRDAPTDDVAAPSLGLVMIAAQADLELLGQKLAQFPQFFNQTVVVF